MIETKTLVGANKGSAILVCDLCGEKQRHGHASLTMDIAVGFAERCGELNGWVNVAVGSGVRKQTVKQICRECARKIAAKVKT